jgi:hypothetical protein
MLAAMLAVSLGTAIYMTVTSSDHIIHYRVILLLLFFSISAASSLIFTSAPNVKLEGNLMGLALSIGGPATMWLVALLLFSHFYEEIKIQESNLQSMIGEYVGSLRKAEWKPYPDWRREHESLSKYLGPDDSSRVRTLLWAAHFTPPGAKLVLPVVSTLFVFFPNKNSLKVQRRLWGRKRADESGRARLPEPDGT